MRFLINSHKIVLGGFSFDILQDRVKGVPHRGVVMDLAGGYFGGELISYFLEEGLERVEFGAVGREVVDLGVLFDEHGGQFGTMFSISVDGTGISDQVNLIFGSFQFGTERAFPQIEDKIFDDLIKLVPIDEAFLLVNEDDPVDHADDKN